MLRVIVTGALAAAIGGCATSPRYTDPSVALASEKWHRQIVEAFDGYGPTTSTKVLAACIAWPTAKDEVPDLITGGWAYTGQGSDIQIFTGDLSRSAMNLCRRNAESSEKNCECQIVDKNGQSTLVIPTEIVALVKK